MDGAPERLWLIEGERFALRANAPFQPKFQSEVPRAGCSLSVAALIHAGDAVVPAEALFVEPGPEETNAERAGREENREDAATHGGAGGVVVGEGAEADAGVTHSGRGLGEGEEEELVDHGEDEEDSGSGEDGELGRQMGGVGEGLAAHPACGVGEGGDEGEQGREDDGGVDDAGHEAEAERGGQGSGLGDEGGVEKRFGGFDRNGLGAGGEQDGGPLWRGGRFLCWRGGDLSGFDLEDAELRCVGGVISLVAKRAFGQARAGFAGGDELARKLDEIGGNLDGGAEVFKDGRLTEGDLFVESFGFGGVDGAVRVGGGRIGQGRGGALDLFVETDGEGGGCRFGGTPRPRIGTLRQAQGRLWGTRLFVRGDLLRFRIGGELVELEEELVLRFGDGVCVEGSDLGGGFGLVDGALGFSGEEGAITRRVGVALGDGGRDAGGTGFGGSGRSDGGERGSGTRATGAVCGEALGDLLL